MPIAALSVICPVVNTPAPTPASPCNAYRISNQIPLTGQGIVTKTMAINAVVDYFTGIMGAITTQAELKACAISIVVDYFNPPPGTPTPPADPILTFNPALDGSTPPGTLVCLIDSSKVGNITGWEPNQGTYYVYLTREQYTTRAVPTNLKIGSC